MRKVNGGVSACRHCQYYLAEGRRGGQCQQLGAPVQGAWKACPLAIPPFAPSWEGGHDVATGLKTWSQESLTVTSPELESEVPVLVPRDIQQVCQVS
jgi:hypothetical protein